ncbi:putative F-box/LRR-repeat protein At3g18150 isoform X2 [Euphorbia lathyris]|uniref:putative F-box/LRR-repeat protein At3g18150 isoform X2 n=1 Tax=Euphorbia lathyris TaxID=212925 RepID=UPI003313262F
MESQRVKVEEEDRISALPDAIIHHILSFLPSTKEAIQTGILSKPWQNQWAGVAVLIFDSTGMFPRSFHKFIENTLILHDCCKIKKFHIQYFYRRKEDQFTSKIRFATRKDVEDLNLSSLGQVYRLPKSLFNYPSLVKLKTHNCIIMPKGKVNWGCLTALNMETCRFNNLALEHILCGSPLLKSLELRYCDRIDKLVIASKSMKRLVLLDLTIMNIEVIEISCPNLEELSLQRMYIDDPKVFSQLIENVLFGCSLLESFELIHSCMFQQLVIASNSLKILVLGNLNDISHIEISCPKLEKLKLSGCLNIETAKLINLPTSICATSDFHYDRKHESSNEKHESLVKDILHQLQNAKELKIGRWFLEILSAIEVGGLFSLVLNSKCLTLNYPDLDKYHSGIACVLRNSPMLEKLVIKLPRYEQV